MALIYVGQLEDLNLDEMQQTYEEEIEILNDLDKIVHNTF